MSQSPCRLLAVDIDGTLVNAGQVTTQDADALRRAAAAGIVVCLCTGRAWKETQPVWRALALPAPHAPVICVGGAVVVEPGTGRSLYSRSFDRPTAGELAEAMRQLGYPVMALVDAWREGFDYYLLGPYEQFPLYRKFFDRQAAKLQFVQSLGEDGHARPVRISVLERPDRSGDVLGQLRRLFGGRAEMQAIHAPNYGVHIVEAFAAGTTKFSALTYVGQGYRLGSSAMAAIGDDYNDISMLAGVGISAAPADAPAEVKLAAKLTVAPRGQSPVAELVARLLAP